MTSVHQKLRALRGKIDLELDLDSLRRDRYEETMAMTLIAPEVAAHLDQLVPPRDALTQAMEDEATKSRFPIIGPACGHLCYLLTRLIGARRLLNASSTIIAAKPAATPQLSWLSSVTTSRPVFLTEANKVALSSGSRVRGSTTSADIPSFESV